ncbi:hypothetical protein BaRGS_00037025, partial [Batillaria attramentaria]
MLGLQIRISLSHRRCSFAAKPKLKPDCGMPDEREACTCRCHYAVHTQSVNCSFEAGSNRDRVSVCSVIRQEMREV